MKRTFGSATVFPKLRMVSCVLTLLCALTAWQAPAWAFDSFEWWGGAAHYELLRQALGPMGFSADAIMIIRSGADSQDEVINRKFTASPHHHCDDNKIPEAWAYIQDRMDAALMLGRDGPLTPDLQDTRGAARRALLALGEGLHTAQDFYCHSNYTELVQLNGLPQASVDWNNRPAGLKSGEFFWNALYDNEGTTMSQPPKELVNDGNLGVLDQLALVGPIAEIELFRSVMISKIGGNYSFHHAIEFENRLTRPDYTQALRYATDEHTVLHYEIAKDGPSTMEGRVITPDGSTLFEKSRELAILETAARWRQLEDRVRSGDDPRAAPWILAAMKGRVLPEVTAAAVRPRERVAPGEILTGEIALAIRYVDGISYDAARPFTVRARLNLTSSPGYGHAAKDIPESGIGLTDGVSTIPLESLQLKAPDEPGLVTLKLEVSLVGDPRNKAYFAEATVLVTGDRTPASGGPGKWMWVRGKPEVTGFGDASLRYSTTSLAYQGAGTDGRPASNTLEWDVPPGRLREGDRVALRMTASSTPGASVGGWYNLGDMSSRSDPAPPGSLNGAGSQSNYRLPESGGSPHAGTLVFTFKPDYEPWVQVSAGHEPNTGSWGLVTWKYTRVPDDGKPSDAELPESVGGGENAASTSSEIVTTTPAAGDRSGDFSGRWRTTWGDWGELVLRQEANRVTGTWGGGGGTLEGTVEGRLLRLKWKTGDGALWGGAKFTLSSDGQAMNGSRNDWKEPEVEQYRWDAVRE